MSDKSEIEAIRARTETKDKRYGSRWNLLLRDRRALLSHVDALEARVAQAYGLLRRYQFVTIQPDDALHDALWDDTARYLAPKMPDKEQPSE